MIKDDMVKALDDVTIWPASDTGLIRVRNEVSRVEGAIMRVFFEATGKRSPEDLEGMQVIQAGGACGDWPIEFAKYFGRVLTLEPDPINFHCLVKNIYRSGSSKKITALNAALSDRQGDRVVMARSTRERNNCGAGFVTPAGAVGGDVATMTLDTVSRMQAGYRVGIIQLDIEGHELKALQGAVSLLRNHRPVVVIEQKRLEHTCGKRLERTFGKPDAAAGWLVKNNGYCIKEIVGNDYILAPETAAWLHRDDVLRETFSFRSGAA